MDDRYTDPRYFGPEDQYQVSGARRSGGEHYSSARDYAAAGELGRERGRRGGYGYGDYGGRSWGNDWDRGGRDSRAERGSWTDTRGYGPQGGNYRRDDGDYLSRRI